MGCQNCQRKNNRTVHFYIYRHNREYALNILGPPKCQKSIKQVYNENLEASEV